MKRVSIVCGILFTAAILSACETDVNTEYAYIRLDRANCSFTAEGNSPVEVAVSATGKWSVEPSASWVKVEDVSDTGVTITVDDNDLTDERNAVLTFSMGNVEETLAINQLAKQSGEYIYRFPLEFDLGAVMSPEGKYVGGRIPVLNEDNSYTHQVIIIDVDADERHIVAEVPSSLFGLEKPYCITDTGVFFLMNNAGGTVAYDLDGNYFIPENYPGYPGGADVQATSSDGKIWAGFARDKFGGEGLYRPLKWVDGVPEILPVPEKNFRDSVWVGGVMARGMSADGSIIYGSSWCNNDFGMCYWDKNGEFHWVGEDKREISQITTDYGFGDVTENIVNGMTCTAELTNISPNGKWIAGTWRKETHPGGGAECAAFFDTENEKTYIFENLAGGFTCTNDGIGFATDGFMSNSGTVVDIESGAVLGSVKDWVYENYGLNVGPGCIRYMTADKQKFLSFVLVDVVATMKTAHWYVAPDVRDAK